MPVAVPTLGEAGEWLDLLANVATAVGQAQGATPPVDGKATAEAEAIAKLLLSGERKAILLGNMAAHHPNASSLLALSQWIGRQTGASVGFLTEAGNTVGAQLVGAAPNRGGLNAAQMLNGGLKAALLLNCEPGPDTSAPLQGCDMVITLSPFKANMDISDVLLPIAPFTETSGTFVNAEGRVQSFHAVVRPLGETRPAWKVLRVLGDMLGVVQPAYESTQEVLGQALNGVGAQVDRSRLSNQTGASIRHRTEPVDLKPVGIYQLDGIVRRAASLQETADARQGAAA